MAMRMPASGAASAIGRLDHHGRQGEPEDGAASGAGIDADLAAHGFDQALGDGQAQARAAEFAGMAGIGLDEFLEDFLALLRRHADAGVAHFEAQEVASRPSDIATSTQTPPFSVNLTALPTRLVSTWRRRTSSMRMVSGTSRRHHGDDLDALGMGARAQKLGHARQQGAQIRLRLLPASACRIRSWRNPECRRSGSAAPRPTG